MMRKMILPGVLMLILVTGCKAKLNSESTVELTSGDMKSTIIDAISKAQDVMVSAKASGGKFNVYVFLAKDKADVEKAVERSKVSDKVIAHKLDTSEADLKANIPANSEAVVLLTSVDAKKVEVKLKLTN
jgi:hypothetical protein